MKKSSKLLAIPSAVLFVWGISDIYSYFSIGKEVLLYYDGAGVISQLVNYSLTQGILKIGLGLCILLILVIRNRTHK